jgi:hypothetical protein
VAGPERQAADVKIIEHAGGHAVVVESGHVDLGGFHVRGNRRLGRAGLEGCRPQNTGSQAQEY